MKDTIIIGAGPAGVSAAVYALRYKMDIMIITQDIGGTALNSHIIENYAGFPSISGMDLGQKFTEQLKHLNIEIKYDLVTEIIKKDNHFVVKTSGEEFEAKQVIITTGLKRRELNVSGEKEYLGKGVGYCVTCDGFFYKDKVTAVIGGGNSAVSGAVMMGDISKKVYLIHRSDEFKADPAWLEEAENNDKIEIIKNTSVTEIRGEKFVKEILLNNEKTLEVDGVFIEIGADPKTEIFKELGLDLNQGYIKVDDKMRTNIKNLYAAGDIVDFEFKQIAVAVSHGAIAADSAYSDLKKK